jgi:hypothetical protein
LEKYIDVNTRLNKSHLEKDLLILVKIIWKHYPNVTFNIDYSIPELEIYIEDKSENYYLPFIKKINNNYINVYPVRRININGAVEEYEILR